MDPPSPPKRMTRARAAKVNSQNTTTTAHTTAMKAKSTASAAANKTLRRQHDANDTDNDQDELSAMPPKSAAAIAAARTTRGRPRKTPAPAAASDDDAPAVRTRAARSTATASTRTSRAKTVASEGTAAENETPVAEARPVSKKRTTTRTASSSKAAAPSGTTRIAVRTGSAAVAAAAAVAEAAAPVSAGLTKKKVTFEEPEKENIAPRAASGAKGKAATARPTATTDATSTAAGLRAKPVRRAETAPAAAKTTTKTAKTAATTTTTKKTTKSTPAASTAPRTRTAAGKPLAAIPLSPKKVTQVRMARGMEHDVDSEDELAALDDAPMLKRSPSKPTRKPANIATAPQDGPPDHTNPALAPSGEDEQPIGTLRSPARRPPPAPFNDGLTVTPARRGNLLFSTGPVLPASTMKLPTGPNPDDVENNNTVSLLTSPAKRFPVPSKMLGGGSSLDDAGRSPFKMSMLQTPAKRPVSPVKAALLLGRSVAKPTSTVTEEPETIEEPESSEEPKEPKEPEEPDNSESLTKMIQDMAADAAEAEAMSDSPSRKSSRGRLSSELPRSARGSPEREDEPASAAPEDLAMPDDPMDVDMSTVGAALLTVSPPKQQMQQVQRSPVMMPAGLRLRDEHLRDDASDSDSDDEDATRLPLPAMPETPCPRRAIGAIGTLSTGRWPLQTDQLGFTPLAAQLSSWKAHSPVATKASVSPTPVAERTTEPESTSSMLEIFDDAMADHAPELSLQHDLAGVETSEPVESVGAVELGDVLLPIFDHMDLMQEDRDLAEEANELTLLEPEQADDAMSEAGSEFNDENAMPVDPALLTVPPVTPQRVLTKTFHTVSKVPLKAAGESTPRSRMRRRSLSVSRMPTRASSRSRRGNGGISTAAGSPGSPGNRSSNSCGLTRSATVISYSPTKKERGRGVRRRSRRVSSGGKAAGATNETTAKTTVVPAPPVSLGAAPTTPTKKKQVSAPVTPTTPASPATSDGGWSTLGTPARTPRRDLNPGLLRGAVVLVDVHTTEGADASGIFVDLLTQMGARCVKSWSETSPTSDTGVTHVVFKDGSQRTLEKVRESQGVVQCVGVSWVLDCERENQWLDEGAYDMDTARVTLGRERRRRRSMEPQSLAKRNGRAVSATGSPTTPAPSTPTNRRRDSALWVRTPEDESSRGEDGGDGEQEGDEDDERDWDRLAGVLTPVPKTPAPEAIARYAASLLPETPTRGGTGYNSADDNEDDDGESMANDENADPQRLGMRTCPPKQACYRELGEGILAREKDERVLMRLMAARRKSLQFAPKIASPLSKAWH